MKIYFKDFAFYIQRFLMKKVFFLKSIVNVISLFFCRRSPSALANLVGLDMLIKDGYAKVTANLKFLNSVILRMLLFINLRLLLYEAFYMTANGVLYCSYSFVVWQFQYAQLFFHSLADAFVLCCNYLHWRSSSQVFLASYDGTIQDASKPHIL